MKTFVAFLKKEGMESVRSGRIVILLLVFLLFGIMNPAIAKITPWMMEAMSESLKDTGLTVTTVTVDALTSWTQFYKNISIILVVFVLMCSSTFTAEYHKGTLIPVVSKGLSRWKIVLAKTTTLVAIWSVCYWFSYGTTYLYNSYFWDNGIALHCGFAATCSWLFGVWIIALIVLFSTIAKSNSTVLLSTGGIVIALYLVGMMPKAASYLPTKLIEGMVLLQGTKGPAEYTPAIVVTIGTAILAYVIAILAFNRKRL